VQEVVQEVQPTGPDALLRTKNKQKRQRQGYEDGLSTTHKAVSAAAFVVAESPLELLGTCTR
jgi:AdoMet-dependent rRNA methyltransferase SPB1